MAKNSANRLRVSIKQAHHLINLHLATKAHIAQGEAIGAKMQQVDFAFAVVEAMPAGQRPADWAATEAKARELGPAIHEAERQLRRLAREMDRLKKQAQRLHREISKSAAAFPAAAAFLPTSHTLALLEGIFAPTSAA